MIYYFHLNCKPKISQLLLTFHFRELKQPPDKRNEYFPAFQERSATFQKLFQNLPQSTQLDHLNYLPFVRPDHSLPQANLNRAENDTFSAQTILKCLGRKGCTLSQFLFSQVLTVKMRFEMLLMSKELNIIWTVLFQHGVVKKVFCKKVTFFRHN